MFVLQLNDIRQGKEWNGKNAFFRFILGASLVCASASLVDGIYIAQGYEYVFADVLAKVITAICYILIPPLYVAYLVYAADMFHRIKEYKMIAIAAMLPAVGILIHACTMFGLMYAGATDVIYDFVKFKVINVMIIAVIIFYSLNGIFYLVFIKCYIGKYRFAILISPIIVLCISLGFWIALPDSVSMVYAISMCFLVIMLFNRRSNGRIDNITGFHTQAAFVDTIKTARSVKKKLDVIIVDITNYNAILQRIGFEDIAISVAHVASVIKKSISSNGIRGYELFYNGNGRFFILVYEKYSSKSKAVGADIVKDMTLENGLGEVDCSVNVNVCCFNFPKDVEDADSIIMVAEDLRKTPHSLRVLAIDELNSSKDFELRRQMNRIIDNAMANNYFSVYYQPIYSAKHDRFASCEALIRLNDPVHGFISPGVFIPLAEKSGVIHKLGRFVIEEVCKFIASDEFKNLNVDYIEVNLSVEQCHRTNLIEEIEEITHRYGIEPSQLNLEITETAACYSENRLVNNLRNLHNLGYNFSLDDFGTGYSNLIRMATLPLSIVKLDRAFVLMDEEDDKFHVIIKNMVKLFKDMGLKILVEGVETAEMVEKFIDIDVDYIQGYYYSRPLPKEDYIEFLKRFNIIENAGKK